MLWLQRGIERTLDLFPDLYFLYECIATGVAVESMGGLVDSLRLPVLPLEDVYHSLLTSSALMLCSIMIWNPPGSFPSFPQPLVA
jgi:hypothetical protein